MKTDYGAVFGLGGVRAFRGSSWKSRKKFRPKGCRSQFN